MFDFFNKMFLKDSDGFETATIICTFQCEELGKDYVIFSKGDDDIGENGKKRLYVAYYEPDKTLTSLSPVTDPEELLMAHDVMNQILSEED